MRKSSDQTAVGFFVIVGFILLALFVFFISGAYLFRPGYSLSVVYDYVSILDRGAPIRMAGVRVGEVNSVELLYDPASQKTRVKIKLFLEKGVAIRDNYEFKIQGTHILSEPHIEITPKPGGTKVLAEGAVVEGVPLVAIEDMIDQAHKIATNLDALTTQFKNMFADEENAKSIKEIVLHLSEITQSLSQILKGNEKSLIKTIQNLDGSTEALKTVLDQVSQGEGTVGKLLYSDELYQELRGFVSEIKTHPWRLLKKDKGK